jgi:hypothetical protein
MAGDVTGKLRKEPRDRRVDTMDSGDGADTIAQA